MAIEFSITRRVEFSETDLAGHYALYQLLPLDGNLRT